MDYHAKEEMAAGQFLLGMDNHELSFQVVVHGHWWVEDVFSVARLLQAVHEEERFILEGTSPSHRNTSLLRCELTRPVSWHQAPTITHGREGLVQCYHGKGYGHFAKVCPPQGFYEIRTQQSAYLGEGAIQGLLNWTKVTRWYGDLHTAFELGEGHSKSLMDNPAKIMLLAIERHWPKFGNLGTHMGYTCIGYLWPCNAQRNFWVMWSSSLSQNRL